VNPTPGHQVDALVAQLTPFLEIPSISAEPAHAEDVLRAGAWVRDAVRAAGGDAEMIDWEGHPLVVGEVPASRAPASAPTVMVYGHFDVQPPEPREQWASDPFVATVRDGWLHARGVADNKGQLFMLLRAVAELAGEEALPVNVRICCDGEEETLGHSIVDFLAADERGADACVIFDFAYQEGRPAFIVATRGMVFFRVHVRTGAGDLHSGMYGGAALNAIHALTTALGATLARDGRLPEPLRAGIAAVDDAEAAAWAQLRHGSQELAAAGARPMDPSAADEFHARTWAEPTVEINGVLGGEPLLQKTVLPVQAQANVSLRLAPGQDADVVSAAFEQLLRDALPAGAELTLERLSSTPAGSVDPHARAIQLGLDAFERATGTRPLLVRAGGTLPIARALADRGIPTIMTGFLPPEANAHAPNEGIPLATLPLGVAAARELLTAWAAL
jgi:acetylornithine deacetylase/succinyl-diaminopimelate desuccinylase-like protein